MKKTIITLAASTFLFLSCGKDRKEVTDNTEVIAVKVAGNTAALYRDWETERKSVG